MVPSVTIAERNAAASKLNRFFVDSFLRRTEAGQRNYETRQRHIKDLDSKVKAKKWEELVPFGTDKEVQLSMTPNNKTRVMEQARHVLKALTLVNQYEHSGQPITWRAVCAQASLELCSTISGRTIELWYRLYREHEGRFPICQQGKATNTSEINPFAKDQGNDDMRNELLSWSRDNLEGLSIARMGEQMSELITPLTENDSNFFVTYNMSWPLQPWTISKWMKELGFAYVPAKKSYMVKIHEREDVVESRGEYIKKCFRDELQESCWIQFEATEFDEFINQRVKKQDAERMKSELIPRAHQYTDESSGKQCYEFHVDDHESFHIATRNLPLGGSPSVRRDPTRKIEICFGQDESTYMPHNLKKMFWALEGMVPMRNKSEGNGIMLSLLFRNGTIPSNAQNMFFRLCGMYVDSSCPKQISIFLVETGVQYSDPVAQAHGPGPLFPSQSVLQQIQAVSVQSVLDRSDGTREHGADLLFRGLEYTQMARPRQGEGRIAVSLLRQGRSSILLVFRISPEALSRPIGSPSPSIVVFTGSQTVPWWEIASRFR